MHSGKIVPFLEVIKPAEIMPKLFAVSVSSSNLLKQMNHNHGHLIDRVPIQFDV